MKKASSEDIYALIDSGEYEKAKEMGCNYIATGHYAKTEYSEEYGRWVLKKSNAGKKDQSYVLWNIPKEILEFIIFPLGDFENKDQIREIARENNLKVANKPDSEDICFVPDGNYKKFLENNSNIKPKQGNIVNSKGEVLGKHTGLYKYTIGQRKGLGIANAVPLFVNGFNIEKNDTTDIKSRNKIPTFFCAKLALDSPKNKKRLINIFKQEIDLRKKKYRYQPKYYKKDIIFN